MKHLLLISFCLLYLFSSAGVSLNLHFCGGKMKRISLQHTDEGSCCKGKMQKKGCCKEKTAFIKVKDTQAAAKTVQLPSHKILTLFSDNNILHAFISTQTTLVFTSADREPPDLCQPPVFLRHRLLLI